MSTELWGYENNDTDLLVNSFGLFPGESAIQLTPKNGQYSQLRKEDVKRLIKTLNKWLKD
jgi:hypothetical protein